MAFVFVGSSFEPYGNEPVLIDNRFADGITITLHESNISTLDPINFYLLGNREVDFSLNNMVFQGSPVTRLYTNKPNELFGLFFHPDPALGWYATRQDVLQVV